MDGKLYAVALHICTGIFVLLFVTTELVLCTIPGSVLSKTCTSVGTFKVTFGRPFEACIEECQRRQRCEIIMYKHGINECSLKDSVNITALTEEHPVCLFTHIENWERTGLSPCDKSSCGLTETCKTSSTDPNRVKCVPSECSRPKAIPNATVFSSMHTVGYKNGYKCDRMYIGQGDPFITCKNNGMWTSTNFKCIRVGKKPTSNVGIADLVSVDGEEWLEGTKLNYACRPGYQGLGVNASSVLNRNGEWWPSVVECCNENITQLVFGKACISAVNGSFVSRHADMTNHCEDKGGSIRYIIDPTLARRLLESGGYHWLLTGAKKHRFLLHLQDCVKMNKVNELLEKLSSYTYEELVAEVVARRLKGDWKCDTARWWAQNEPNGGDAKDCVVFRNGTYGMIDVDCSSFAFAGRSDIAFGCKFPLPKI